MSIFNNLNISPQSLGLLSAGVNLLEGQPFGQAVQSGLSSFVNLNKIDEERSRQIAAKNIQDDLKRYPASTRILIKTFKSNDLWQDLKVSDVQRLVLWSNMSLVEISHNDLMYGGKFLVNDDEYIVSITG